MVTSLGVMRIFPIQIITEEGRVIKGLCSSRDKLGLFQEYWSPRIVGELNDSYVKLVKLKGEFVWHQHENEDELFLVVKGRLLIKLRGRDLWIGEGEFVIVPRGVEHCPVAEDEVHVLLLEPKSTVNTGDVLSEWTVASRERLRHRLTEASEVHFVPAISGG